MKFPMNFYLVKKINSPPGLPSHSRLPQPSPGGRRPWVHRGEPCAQPERSLGWPYVPRLIHALRTQRQQPSIAASVFPDSSRRQVPILISSPGGEAHTRCHPLCVHTGQRLTAAPLPQAAKNVNLHTPPLRCPPPVPVPFSAPPVSQWASGSLSRSCLLSVPPSPSLALLPRQHLEASSLALPEGHLPRLQLAAKISLSTAKCLLLSPQENTGEVRGNSARPPRASNVNDSSARPGAPCRARPDCLAA